MNKGGLHVKKDTKELQVSFCVLTCITADTSQALNRKTNTLKYTTPLFQKFVSMMPNLNADSSKFIHLVNTMKFEDFLTEKQNHEQQKKMDLEEEVPKRQDLDRQNEVNTVLQCPLHGPTISHPNQSSLLPLETQVLLAEVTMVEKEIICLERKVEELKMCLYEERKQNKAWRTYMQQQKKQPHGSDNKKALRKMEQAELSFSNTDLRSQRWSRERNNSSGFASEISPQPSTKSNDETIERSINDQNRKQKNIGYWTCTQKPNRVSEDIIKCLIGIFLKLNKSSSQLEGEGSTTVPKLTLSCINSKGFASRTSFNCVSPMSFLDEDITSLDPYGILPDPDLIIRDIGPYKNFVQFTRNSLDLSRLSECFPAIQRLRILMHELSTVELSFLTYKQKLAFWINIYNACIMHALLQYGLPSEREKQLALMNKAALNVGGIVLNALAIEHFILRHPYGSKKGSMDEKERLLRHAYGLGYPEPNIIFALCRGSWSSPALRIYTAEEVVNELGRAKIEYLEASIGLMSKKKIVIPKLLHWHMQDFADNMESLLEWIYSQLPQFGPVKRKIMECLNKEAKSPIVKHVEVQRYEAEFRYLMPRTYDVKGIVDETALDGPNEI